MRVMAIGAAMVVAAPAVAQVERPDGQPMRPAPAPDGWSLTVGAAPVLSPAWQGSRETSLSIFPDLRVAYRDLLFASVPDGIGLNLVNRGGWKVGPFAKIRFGRDERNGGSPFLIAGGSDALLGLGDVKAAGEVGGFVEKAWGPLRARGEVRKGFGGHDGVVADLSASYRARMGRMIGSIGPRATVASGAFMQSYFGIDARQSIDSGLARYDADGGLLSYGVGGTVVRPIDRRQAITLFTSLERLGGPAGQSPLVRERGRRAQFTLGLGYGFRL